MKGAEGSEAERQYVQQSQDQERAHVVDLGHAARAVSSDGARAMVGKGVLVCTLTQNEGSTISPGPEFNRNNMRRGSCDVLFQPTQGFKQAGYALQSSCAHGR